MYYYVSDSRQHGTDMPLYEYQCDRCGQPGEHFQSMSEPPRKRCPHCRSTKYRRVFSEPNAIVRGNPRTVGQAAEENEKRLGKERVQRMWEAEAEKRTGFTGKMPDGAERVKKKPVVPPWRDGSLGNPRMAKPLDHKKVNTPAKRKRYIEEGKL